MKKFIIKVSIFLITIGLVSTIFCIKVDPFNVFHPLDIVDNGVEPNKNFIKMTYILNNPDKFDSFVFGSSRVGNIHVNNITGQKAYNMTYSEATPKEILNNIKTLIENGIVPKNIYVGVDNLSYTIDPARHNDGLSTPYEESKTNPIGFYSKYLDPAMVLKSYVTIIKDHKFDEFYAYRFYEFGWNSDYDDSKSKYDFDNAEPSVGKDYLLEETLEDIKGIVDICKENGINYVIFTNPMYYVTYEAALKQNYIEFLRGLAEITEFCNFSGYNTISTDSSNWIDSSHYNAYVSDMVIECMCFGAYYWPPYDEGFGRIVNKDNIEDIINVLNLFEERYKNAN